MTGALARLFSRVTYTCNHCGMNQRIPLRRVHFFERFRQFGFPVTRVGALAEIEALPAATVDSLAAVVIEPLIQGVNEMRPWPAGSLAALRRWCDDHDVHLILDEVMTGFGRTGTMFACQQEEVVPDFLCLAKGLTGGYLPLAATLTTREVFEAGKQAAALRAKQMSAGPRKKAPLLEDD